MTRQIELLAAEDIAALVCDGSGFRVIGAGADPGRGTTTISFSEEVAGDVLWRRVDGQAGGAQRTIATSGDDLWRRAPWPAADDLFGWPAGDRIVVVGSGAEIVAILTEAEVDVEAVSVLGPDALRAAAVVVFAGTAGDPLPAEAPAVLAAGRILVTTPRTPDFGLRAGIDYCVGPAAGDLAELALSAIRHPRAFDSMRVYGRLAAERHRASRVLADLALDLELGF